MVSAGVEERLLVGAGSLVPPGKQLETSFFYIGTPVRRLGARTAGELDMLEYSAKHFVQLKNRYPG